MTVFFVVLWLIDRFAWKYTKLLGKVEDQTDFDFVNKFSQVLMKIMLIENFTFLIKKTLFYVFEFGSKFF